MKKYTNIILVTVFLMDFISACKKNNIASPGDNNSSVKEKTWWGVFTSTGKDAEYYSVHFNADNTLLWSQFSGDYTGQWAISGKGLIMVLDESKAEIKAVIGDDGKLLNITDNTGNFEINTGQLIANANMPLDNTEWKGKMVTGLPYIVELSFRPPLKADIQLGNSYTNNTYTRSASGAVIRAYIKPVGSGPATLFFGIIISGTEMTGSDKNSNNQWQVTRK